MPQYGFTNPPSQLKREHAPERGGDLRGTSLPPQPQRLKLPPVDPELPLEQRVEQARLLAMEVFAQTGSWVVFFREMLGVGGVCTKLFPTPVERRYFESTEVYAELQEIIAVLRGQSTGKADGAEPEKVITIRLPVSLHKALVVESQSLNLSVNKLCISKLLQTVDGRFIPDQRGKIPGRKPGPQSFRRTETD